MNRRVCMAAGLAWCAVAAVRCGTSQGTASEARKPPVAVEVKRAALGQFTESVSVVGTLTPKYEANVKAEYPGTVAEVYVTEWVPVKKGTLLARLDTREAEAAVQAAKAAVLQSEAAANGATREHQRAIKLKDVGLITQQAVDDALTVENASAAALEAARAQLRAAETRLAKASIVSPMDGAVAMRAVSAGDYAGGDPIFRIVDTRIFDLKVTVPSSRMHAVAVGQVLTFTTDAVPDKTFEGAVAFINPAADPASRTVQVVAEVKNPDSVLRAGLFVKGRILTRVRPGVLMVPRPALVNWDLTARSADLFVVDGDTARMRSIRTGAVEGDDVEVLGGIEEGAPVVTRGAFLLADGDQVALTAAEGTEGT